MAWFKVDDKLTSHRKFLRLGRIYGVEVRCMAMGLWVQAGSWSALSESNWFIPEDITEEFAPVTVMSHVTGSDAVDVREALCDVGLWSRTDDGYQFEGWAEYQPTKQGADEKRARDAERKRRSRARKSDVTQTSAVTDSDASAVTACPSPPSRPDPSRPDLEPPNGGSRKTARAARSVEYSPEFERFWAEYPRHEAKRQAWKAWGRALNRADAPTIIAGARRYAADPNRAPQFTKHGSTWLNADGWEDEPLPARSTLPAVAGDRLPGTHASDWLRPVPDWIDADVVEPEVIES